MKKILIAALWLPLTALAQSYPSPHFNNVTIDGTLTAATSAFTNPVPVTSGGTGAATASGARTNLSAAASGANSDITSLTGLTTPLSVAQGGSGLATIPQYNVLLGSGTGAVSAAAPSATAGLPFVSNGSAANPSFQALTNLGQVTAYNGISTIANGIPSEYAQINLTAQTASVASATLYAVPSSGAGFYLAIVDTICTTAGTAGTVSATIGWNNGSAAAAAASGAMSLSTLGNETTQIFTVYSAASQNITYSTTVTGAAGSPQYSVRIRLVYLG